MTRRTLLRGAAGGAALAAAGGLPAWARPAGQARHHLRRPDSLPFPHLPAGTESLHHIKHIVVLMMENHSFDNLLGMVPHQIAGRGNLDGLTRSRTGRIVDHNPGANGGRVFAQHSATPCQDPHLPNQTWDASHESWGGGRMDGFVRASGDTAMLYWDKSDIPFTYSLAQHFPVGERFFCSVLAQTYPNRRFFFAGTASGLIATDLQMTLHTPARNGTIWDRLDPHNIGYAVYYQNLPSWAIIPGAARPSRQHKFDQFYPDVAAGKLPAFTFLDPNYNTTSQENPQDIQVGERFIARVVNALIDAPTWRHTALFITYDEHGGYYDHVPPPRAVKPDNIPPMLSSGDFQAGYTRYGFRVPLIVVSPWAKKGYISRVVQDHTSLDAFIERKWNLPAMTFRDANADAMTDYFDFRRPAFATPPKLAAAPSLQPGLERCRTDGFNPPLPRSKYDGAGDVGR